MFLSSAPFHFRLLISYHLYANYMHLIWLVSYDKDNTKPRLEWVKDGCGHLMEVATYHRVLIAVLHFYCQKFGTPISKGQLKDGAYRYMYFC